MQRHYDECQAEGEVMRYGCCHLSLGKKHVQIHLALLNLTRVYHHYKEKDIIEMIVEKIGNIVKNNQKGIQEFEGASSNGEGDA